MGEVIIRIGVQSDRTNPCPYQDQVLLPNAAATVTLDRVVEIQSAFFFGADSPFVPSC